MNTNVLNTDNNKLKLLEKKIENLENKLQLLENIIMQNTIKNFDFDIQQVIPNTEVNFDNENINRSINISSSVTDFEDNNIDNDINNNIVYNPPNIKRQFGFNSEI